MKRWAMEQAAKEARAVKGGRAIFKQFFDDFYSRYRNPFRTIGETSGVSTPKSLQYPRGLYDVTKQVVETSIDDVAKANLKGLGLADDITKEAVDAAKKAKSGIPKPQIKVGTAEAEAEASAAATKAKTTPDELVKIAKRYNIPNYVVAGAILASSGAAWIRELWPDNADLDWDRLIDLYDQLNVELEGVKPQGIPEIVTEVVLPNIPPPGDIPTAWVPQPVQSGDLVIPGLSEWDPEEGTIKPRPDLDIDPEIPEIPGYTGTRSSGSASGPGVGHCTVAIRDALTNGTQIPPECRSIYEELKAKGQLEGIMESEKVGSDGTYNVGRESVGPPRRHRRRTRSR
jgi:hypothetical protein